MDLPLLSALFAAFAIALYVMLDGFDLGVGAMLLAQTDEQLRDQMVDSIMPTWDGNETWLIMAGVALLAAFPIAYGVLLPAFYLPLIIMLLALGLRGVSFEFRFQAIGARRFWDLAFGLGSIVAALMQGLIVGGLIQGVTVSGESFGGSVFDVFRPFPVLAAVTILTGYIVLGAGWLHLKATLTLRRFAERGLRVAVPCFAALAVATCAVAVFVQPGVRAAWAAYPYILAADQPAVCCRNHRSAAGDWRAFRRKAVRTRADPVCPRGGGPWFHHFPRRRPLPPDALGRRVHDPQPRLPLDRRRHCDAGRARLFRVCLPRLPGQDARNRVGRMSPRIRRLSWFGGLYLASVSAVVVLTFAIRAVLWLVS